MREIIICEYNTDTVCVDVFFSDGAKISIDCTAVENELDVNTVQQTDLDWLIYNEPITYSYLILCGGLKEYLSQPSIHKLCD